MATDYEQLYQDALGVIACALADCPTWQQEALDFISSPESLPFSTVVESHRAPRHV